MEKKDLITQIQGIVLVSLSDELRRAVLQKLKRRKVLPAASETLLQ